MSSVQIRILVGPNTGARLRVDKDNATFGRAPECDITIDQPFISREHGQIALTPKGWVLQNKSPNGTSVAGKLITKKPRPVADGSVVAIGDQDVFEIVELATPEPVVEPEEAVSEDGLQKQKLSGRHKLWIGIGVFWLIMLGVFFMGKLSSDGAGDTDVLSSLPPLSESEIEDKVKMQIRQPLPKQPPNSRLVQEHSQRAFQAYKLRDNDPKAYHRALQEYHIALSYTDGPALQDPEDDKRFIAVQEKLIELVSTKYHAAYNALRARQFDKADQRYRELTRIYTEPGSDLHAQIEYQWALTRDLLPR